MTSGHSDNTRSADKLGRLHNAWMLGLVYVAMSEQDLSTSFLAAEDDV